MIDDQLMAYCGCRSHRRDCIRSWLRWSSRYIVRRIKLEPNGFVGNDCRKKVERDTSRWCCGIIKLSHTTPFKMNQIFVRTTRVMPFFFIFGGRQTHCKGHTAHHRSVAVRKWPKTKYRCVPAIRQRFTFYIFISLFDFSILPRRRSILGRNRIPYAAHRWSLRNIFCVAHTWLTTRMYVDLCERVSAPKYSLKKRDFISPSLWCIVRAAYDRFGRSASRRTWPKMAYDRSIIM